MRGKSTAFLSVVSRRGPSPPLTTESAPPKSLHCINVTLQHNKGPSNDPSSVDHGTPTREPRRGMADDNDASQLLFPEKTDALTFPLYHTQPIDKASDGYRRNINDWAGVLKEHQEGLEWCASQGTKHYEDRHKRRGLLLGSPKTNSVMTGVLMLFDSAGSSSSSFGSGYPVS
jgi:hypothetical protein